MSTKTKNCDSENNDTESSCSPTPLFGRVFDEPVSSNEAVFPVDSLKVVSTKLRAFQWSIPVEPGGALERVLLACNKVAETGDYENCPEFKQFFAKDAVSLFAKLLNDTAGQNWDDITNHYIFTHCLLTIRVFALLAENDYVYVYYVAENIFNPESRFQIRFSQNYYRRCIFRFGSRANNIERFEFIINLLPELENPPKESDLRTYASPDCQETLPLMFDFINLFGRCGGFDNLLRRFKCLGMRPLSVPLIYTYLRPFKLCSYLLHDSIKNEYIVPIVNIVLDVFKHITEAEIHQLFRNDQRSSHLADFVIIRVLNFCVDKSTYSQVDVDKIHLDLILKTMKIDLFGAKMSALTEIISNIQGADSVHGSTCIAKGNILAWIRENEILSNLLHENLHQPQYVKKVARIVRFLLECDKLSLDDLDDIWKAQVGRHDVIAQNVESLIIQSVKYFTRDHLDQLFYSFKTTVLGSTKQQQERVIRLIPRLVAEDPEGLAESAATFLWELSIRPFLLPEISSAALKAHYEVLNTAVTEAGLKYLVERWLLNFAEILKDNTDDYAVDFAARQMIKVFRLLNLTMRYEVLLKFTSMGIIMWCINGLRKYVDKHVSVSRVAHDPGTESVSSRAPSTTSTLSRGEAATVVTSNSESTSLPVKVKPSDESFHTIPFCDQLRDRLDLIHFLATESERNLTMLQLDQLWNCLIVETEVEHETSSFTDTDSLIGGSSFSDTLEGRNISFKWFSPTTNILVHSYACFFFHENVMKIKPELLTPAGMELFKCFFEFVNKECEISADSEIPFGLDYLWNIVLVANDKVARIGIEMLRELFMKDQRSGKLGLNFIKKCNCFLASSYNKILENIRALDVVHVDGSLCRFYSSVCQQISSAFMQDAEQDLMVIDRVIRVLRCFLMESDRNFMVIRSRLPLFQSWCGSALAVKANFRPVLRDSDVDKELIKLGASRGMQYRSTSWSIITHANETLGNLQRRLLALCLAEIIPSLSSKKVTSKGDEAEASFASIVDEFELKIDSLRDVSRNMNISTYLLMTSHDPASFDEDFATLITFDVRLCLLSKRSQGAAETPEDFFLTGIHSKSNSFSASLGNCSSSSSIHPPRLSTQGEDVKFESPALELENEDQPDGGNDSMKNSVSRSSLLDSSRNSSKAEPVFEEAFYSSGEMPDICSESHLPDYIISEDQNFVRLLLDVGNMAVFLGVEELRDLIFDVLFSLPINLTYQEALQKCFASRDEMRKLQGLLTSSLFVLDLPCSTRDSFDDFEHGGITQQLYFLQIIYATLYPSSSDTHGIIFPKETFVHMHSFLQSGGLVALLSASALQKSKASSGNPLSQLVFLWLCRIINLCLFCSVHSLEVTFNRDNPFSQRLSTLWQSATQGELAFCDFAMQKYVEAFGDYVTVTEVTADEIRTKWLKVPPQSCKRLRDIIWMINSIHSRLDSGPTLPLDWEISPVKLNVKLAASHDSGCVSPRNVFANQSTSPGVSCTFSTTCGLKPAALQTFFQIGRYDTDLFSPDCVSMLLPNKVTIQPNSSVIPFLLSLRSGRTPGCLSTCAMSALAFLLTLCPDSDLTALLQKSFPFTLDNEVAKGWLDFLRSILFQSPSPHLRHFSVLCAHVVISCGFMSFTSDIPDESVSATEISEFMLKYLIQTINEADSNNALHCSNAVDLFLSVIGTLLARRHIPSFLPQMFIDEWNWLLRTIKVPCANSTEGMGFSPPAHFTISDLVRSHLRLCTCLTGFQDTRLFDPNFVGHIDLKLLDAIIMSILFPAAVRHTELVFKPDSAVSEAITSATTIVAICKALAPPSHAVAESAFSLLAKLLVYSPAHFVPLIADQLTTLLFIQSPVSFSWDGMEDRTSPSQGVSESNEVEFSDVPVYVGLRNPGSLCYMNAVLQQVFAILPIRNAVLSAPVLKILKEAGVNASVLYSAFGYIRSEMDETKLTSLCSLFGLQDMFAFLAYTRQAYYEPTHFWRHFKLWGMKIAYNEQHDAQEFFSCFVDTIDQAMTLCGMPKVIEQYLGGSFADQKECIRCHQVYSREETFLAISVDIQNRSSLLESLEDYVKSDLLEGNDAYFCEKCNEKVTARKRTCVKRLPQILTIHLKRFIYDYERGLPEKSDDYFSFPMCLDMSPYTVEGVTSRDEALEGGISTNGSDSRPIFTADPTGAGLTRNVTRYILRGVVVHSGRASGGHYFSYIRHVDQKTGKYVWHLFNDAKVSEADLDSPATIHEKWFGGVNSAPYNFSLSSYRHWSAYMLFYEREDFRDAPNVSQLCSSLRSLSLSEINQPISPCPAHIASKIYAQDVEYFNKKAITSPAFRNFMFFLANIVENPGTMQKLDESTGVLCSLANLIFHYCFDMYFRLKGCEWLKWFKPLLQLLQTESSVQKIFADITVFSIYNLPHDIFFKCPSTAVQFVYSTLLFLVMVHNNNQNGSNPLGEQVLQRLLREFPNCFHRDCAYEEVVFGPQNINDTFWPSPHESVKNLLKGAAGGQLFALLFDYLRVHKDNVDRLGKFGLHIEMIKFIMENIPKSSVGTRKLTETIAVPPESDPFEFSMGHLRTILGPELLDCVQESARMFLITDLAKQHNTNDSDLAISFSPNRNSSALIAVGGSRAHLFHLSLVLTVHYSPLNLLLKCLLMFFQRALESDSCLEIEEIVTDIDFSTFVRVLLNNCLNQGSAFTIFELLSTLVRNVHNRSRIVLKSLAITIFNQIDASTHTRILVDLAISILLELLSYQDSLWEFRMQFVFDPQQDIDILTKIERHNPTTPITTGMRMLQAIAAVTSQNMSFSDFFCRHDQIGSRLSQIITTTLGLIIYPTSIAARPYEEVLNDALAVLPELPAKAAENEGTSSPTLSATNEAKVIRDFNQSLFTPSSHNP